MRGIAFTRSGNLGGILFSLHFIRDCSERKGAGRALMPLTYGKPAVCAERRPDGDAQTPERSAGFIMPFLGESGLFTDVQAAEWAKAGQTGGQLAPERMKADGALECGVVQTTGQPVRPPDFLFK